MANSSTKLMSADEFLEATRGDQMDTPMAKQPAENRDDELYRQASLQSMRRREQNSEIHEEEIR